MHAYKNDTQVYYCRRKMFLFWCKQRNQRKRASLKSSDYYWPEPVAVILRLEFSHRNWMKVDKTIYQHKYICCVFRPANACLHMCLHGQKQWKSFKNHKKVSFLSCVRKDHVRCMNILGLAIHKVILFIEC